MQRYFGYKKEDTVLELIDDDIYHITKVMRMKENDNIEVVYNNKLYLCSIFYINNKLFANIISEIENNNNDAKKFNIIIPLLKEQKMDLILQKATELGADNIYLCNFQRSIVKLDDNRISKKLERWYKICKEASEQSKRINIPLIHYFDDLKALKNIDGNKILCSTKKNLDNIRLYLKNKPFCDKINVVIGPEGGITDQEEKMFNDMGFISITLGERILRVETVPIYILSILNYEYME